MTGLIYILRHGESIVNLEHRLTCKNYAGDLTELGREQSHKAGMWLQDNGITAIYASPYHRTQQTAEIISSYLNLAPVTDDGLCEMNCGSLASQPEGRKTFWKIYKRWLAGEFAARYPDGESLTEGIERYRQALQRACLVEGNALVITHGGISRSVIPLLCRAKNASEEFGNVDKTGVIILEPQPDSLYRCNAWNLLEHLESA